jgi:L-ascorbate metabolism protein UlaG (beta-lactamase superfamily)
MNIRFLGHAAFSLEAGGTTVAHRPVPDRQPKAAASADEVKADAILLTHGHPTTMATSSTSPSAPARRWWPSPSSPTSCPRSSARTTPSSIRTWVAPSRSTGDRCALCRPGTPRRRRRARTTRPAGLLIELDGTRVYHLGDTCLFSDLQLVKRYGRIDVAIVPIGGHYTMDRFDAVVAAEWVGRTR